jgi:hypothetical protein
MRRLFLLCLVPALLSGCAIDRAPLRQTSASFDESSLNNPLAPQVTPGNVAIGYTPEMVQRALGEPKQIRMKASGGSVAATWIYPALTVTFREGQVASIDRDDAKSAGK